jgi:hypothetical protein
MRKVRKEALHAPPCTPDLSRRLPTTARALPAITREPWVRARKRPFRAIKTKYGFIKKATSVCRRISVAPGPSASRRANVRRRPRPEVNHAFPPLTVMAALADMDHSRARRLLGVRRPRPSRAAALGLALLSWIGSARAGVLSITTCNSATEYFDTTSLTCVECNDNSDGTGNNLHKVPDPSVVDVYGNPLRCKCADGYAEVTQSCTDAVSKLPL